MKVLTGGILLLALWTVASVFLYITNIRDFSVPAQQVQAETVVPSPPLTPAAVKPDKLLIYFDSDRSVFNSDESAEKQFSLFSTWIKENPGAQISITGHADASGSDSYNMDLGTRRAQSVRDYMIKKGIPPGNLSASSKGEKEPVSSNDSPEGKALNRRSEIILK